MSKQSEGWDLLLSGQRFTRAKYIADFYLAAKDPWNAKEISDDLSFSDNPREASAVRALIDLYAVGTGIVTGIGSPRLVFSAGRLRLRLAWQTYADEVTVTKAQTAKARKQFPNADQVTIDRIAFGRALGDWLLAHKKIDQDGSMAILNTPDPRSAEIADKPLTIPEWRAKFGQHATKTRAFSTFLRGSKQSMMVDEHLAVQLHNFSETFNGLADRFDVGVAKAEAHQTSS